MIKKLVKQISLKKTTAEAEEKVKFIREMLRNKRKQAEQQKLIKNFSLDSSPSASISFLSPSFLLPVWYWNYSSPTCYSRVCCYYLLTSFYFHYNCTCAACSLYSVYHYFELNYQWIQLYYRQESKMLASAVPSRHYHYLTVDRSRRKSVHRGFLCSTVADGSVIDRSR